jgi:hypothetical protein
MATSAPSKKMLRGGAAKSRKVKLIAPTQKVWGNGSRPDRYAPNTPYRPNPPANQKTHPVTGNER